jgi:hypothetical protein
MSADIDIDLPDRQQLLDLIEHIPAHVVRDGRIQVHNSGVYVQAIPRDARTGFAAIDYQKAEDRGYFKLDLLNMTVYQMVRDSAHYEAMLARDPPWTRLWEDTAWAQQLVHVGNYTQLLVEMRPDSITRMAAFISIIRPGKAHLQGHSWDEIFASVWDGDDSRGYVFKKSHAISYACLVALHMNLLHSAD